MPEERDDEDTAYYIRLQVRQGQTKRGGQSRWLKLSYVDFLTASVPQSTIERMKAEALNDLS